MRPLLLILVLTQAIVAATDDREAVRPAPPKRGKTVDPPLSADPPQEWTALSSFGTIRWETTHLPWVEKGPYAGISGVAMAAHGSDLYVTGGFIPGGDETDDKNSRRTSRWTWVLNTRDGTWKRLADAPVRREYTRGIMTSDAFYLIGGGCQYRLRTPRYRVHGDTFRLNLHQNPPAWQTLGRLNVPRTHTAVGHVGHYLVVTGGNEYDAAEQGYSPSTIRSTNEVYDLRQPQSGWQQRADLPGQSRGWCASTAADGALYLFGGITWTAPGVVVGTRETLRYDPETDTWKQKSPPPVAVSGWEGALYDGRTVLMAGGVARSDQEPVQPVVWSDLVWAYDVPEDRWRRVEGVLPPGAVFNDPGVAIVGDTIYVLGAEGPHGSHYDYLLIGRIQPGPD